jgi:hypothetical protein
VEESGDLWAMRHEISTYFTLQNTPYVYCGDTPWVAGEHGDDVFNKRVAASVCAGF